MSTQVSLENTSALGRCLTVEVSPEAFGVKYNARLEEARKTATVPGFRKGQVSPSFFEQRFGASVLQEVVAKTIEETLPQALTDHKLKVVGQPEIKETNIEALLKVKGKAFSEGLSYSALFEVYPVIEIAPVANITLTKKTVDITSEDIETLLTQWREQLGAWIPVERLAKIGDRVTISYTSLLEGKPYEEGQADEVQVQLGRKQFIEGFETGLLEKAKGETVVLDLVFPSDWRLEKLAGKPVQFTIQIKEVAEKQLATLDEAFAKGIRAASAATEDLEQAARQFIEKRLDQIVRSELREQMADKVLAATPFDLPKALVEQEKSSLHAEMHQQEGHADHASCGHDHADLTQKAERRVALGLLLNDVIQRENLTVDNKRVQSRIQEIAENFGNNNYIGDMYLRSPKLLQAIHNAVLTEQALDCLIEKAQVDALPSTVKELLQW